MTKLCSRKSCKLSGRYEVTCALFRHFSHDHQVYVPYFALIILQTSRFLCSHFHWLLRSLFVLPKSNFTSLSPTCIICFSLVLCYLIFQRVRDWLFSAILRLLIIRRDRHSTCGVICVVEQCTHQVFS